MSLPLEMLLEIASYMVINDLLTLAQVNKILRAIAMNIDIKTLASNESFNKVFLPFDYNHKYKICPKAAEETEMRPTRYKIYKRRVVGGKGECLCSYHRLERTTRQLWDWNGSWEKKVRLTEVKEVTIRLFMLEPLSKITAWEVVMKLTSMIEKEEMPKLTFINLHISAVGAVTEEGKRKTVEKVLVLSRLCKAKKLRLYFGSTVILHGLEEIYWNAST